ncbi:MAG: NAD(+) diphosphatase [Peptococcaceae bacterium]|nr:NAD(+) diphosphatase [Peptococcaceae bacterium]
MKFIPGIIPPTSYPQAYWFAYCQDKLLIVKEAGRVSPPLVATLAEYGISTHSVYYLGTLDGYPAFAALLADDTAIPTDLELLGLRQLFSLVADEWFYLAGRARQIIEWDKTHQFCGRCGSTTTVKTGERAKLCPNCGLLSYPVISPAIIVAITRGNEILLARGTLFAVPMYSVLAGFVEPGETLEECVAREVKEEVGLEIKDIRYFGSQPWPFPHSLMVGFTAEYAGGDLKLDPAEIIDAQWYKADNLPLIPDKISIARRLIDWFSAKTPIG